MGQVALDLALDLGAQGAVSTAWRRKGCELPP